MKPKYVGALLGITVIVAGSVVGHATVVRSWGLPPAVPSDPVTSYAQGPGPGGGLLAAAGPLSVEKVDQRDPVPATWLVVYQIRVQNAGTSVLDGVTVVDTLPDAQKTYYKSSSPAGAYDPLHHTLAWSLNDVAEGGCVNLEVRLGTFTTAVGMITNTVTAQWESTVVSDTETTIISRPPRPTNTPTPTPTATATATPTHLPTVTPTDTPTPTTGNVLACAWNDLDSDGEWTGNETALQAVVVELHDSASQFVGACTTGGDGCCEVGNLEPGNLAAMANLNWGFYHTTPDIRPVEVRAGEVSAVSFGYRRWCMLYVAVVTKVAQ